MKLKVLSLLAFALGLAVLAVPSFSYAQTDPGGVQAPTTKPTPPPEAGPVVTPVPTPVPVPGDDGEVDEDDDDPTACFGMFFNFFHCGQHHSYRHHYGWFGRRGCGRR